MPPKIRARRNQGQTKLGSISYASDEETPIFAAAEVYQVSNSDYGPVTLPEAYTPETGATRDTTNAPVQGMDPEVAKSILRGLTALQDNYGSLRDMMTFQEQLTRRILERQDEVEKAFNAKLDEGVPLRFPGSTEGSTDGNDTEAQDAKQDLLWGQDGQGEAPEPVKVNRFLTEAPPRAHEHHETFLHKVVESKQFEWCSAAVIFTHSIFISVYVEYLATVDFDGHKALTYTNMFLTLLFLGEVAVKVFVERQEYFHGCERRWNYFDLLLIMLVIVQIALMVVLAGKDKKKMKTVLKIAEMARTTRILRIFRFLKFSSTLQIIIFKIFRSIRTLSWVMVLMFMMIWVVAVCFTQGSNDFLAGRQFDDSVVLSEHEQGLIRHFGSVGKSMKTCFATISGGIVWMEVYSELEDVSALYSIIFAVYIFAANFAMFNIITGIFMNDMHRADQDFETELVEKKMETQHLHLASMFDDLDDSGDGSISLDEFLQMAHHPVIREYLEAVGIGQEDAHMLFYLLDEDGSGEITIREFLNGSHALTKASTGMDMKVILYESRHMRGAFTTGMNHLDSDLEEIRATVDDVKSRLRFLSPEPKIKNRNEGHRTTISQPKRPIPHSVANLRKSKKNVLLNMTEGCTPDPLPPAATGTVLKKERKTKRLGTVRIETN